MLEFEKIHFYHTNDIHSHFENWPQINRFLCNEKMRHTREGNPCYNFDIGDHVDRSHPYTEGTDGKGNILLLNEAGYDAVTIGNNEGITMSKKALSELYDKAEFDVIIGNLFDEEGSTPSWALPSTVYVTSKGTRIGVIGATSQYTEFYSKLGWRVSEPLQQLKRIAHDLSNETDLIVCLSHLGITADEKLAAECKDINIIFGAHTHHLFHDGKWIGNTLLAATGKYGEYVGHVTVELQNKKITQMTAIVKKTDEMEQEVTDVQRLEEMFALGNVAMQERVFYNATSLTQNLFATSPLSSFFGSALLAYTKADCALFNAGIFIGNLHEGWVTKGDLHALLPHPINPCVVTLSGSELLEIYQLSLNEEWPHIEVRGLGFRGELMGAMIHEMLYINSLGELYVGNRIVVPDEIYTLATLDMFTFGFFFPTFKNAKKEYYMPELIRDVLAWYGDSLSSFSRNPPPL